MSIRRDLECTLRSWAVDGAEAYEVVGEIFDSMIAALRRHFPTVTRDTFDLMLADARRDAERELYALIDDTVRVDTATELVATGFPGED